MKNLSTLSHVGLVAACLAFYSCENVGDDVQPDNSVVPAEFGIDIPSSISDTETIEVNRPGDNANGRVTQSDDDLHGGHIYRHLRTYIHVGDKSAELVRDIMQSLRRNNINRAMAFTYKGDDDGRDKNLLVEENVAFEGRTWDYGLYVTDADSEGEADGGKAMQIFWNTSPVEGVAILNPYNLDRRNDRIYQATMYRIDYSEVGDQNYDKHMIVQISDWYWKPAKFLPWII